MKNPKVSIIIPVYNGANFVAEAIESALAQTYPNFEVVVINDGSKDDGATDKICKNYGKKIRYYKKPNGGVASALNMGIAKMKGEYFSWLSHDDLYFPNKLSKEVAFILKNPNKTLIYSNYEEVDQTGSHLEFSKLKDISPEKFLAALIKNRFLHGCTLLIPKEAFEEGGLFDLALRNTQDYDLWFRFLEKGWQFKLCPEALVKSRKHNKQTSISTSDRQKQEDDALYLKLLDKFELRQLTLRKSITLGLVKFAISWQFLGCPKAAKKAHSLSLQYLKKSDYVQWFIDSSKYYFLIIFSRPLLKLMDLGARIKRFRKGASQRHNHDISDKPRVCFIGNIDSSHNVKYAKFCLRHGYDVHFITFHSGEIKGAKIYPCLQRVQEPKFLWFLRSLFLVRKLVRKIRPTFIQGQYLSSGGVLAYLADYRPYIVSVLGSDVLEPLPPYLNFLSRQAVLHAEWTFVSSEILRKAALSFGAQKDKISIFRFGIDLGIFKPSKSIKTGKDKIIFSPRFIDRIYNITIIIKAFNLLNPKNVKLALIDKPISDSYYQEVKDLIARYNLHDKVIWLSQIENDKMAEYYNMSEVVVSIPNSEGAGVSVFEAMACEKKIIIGELPVFKEWERKNNFFKTKINPQDLKNAMLEALKMPAIKFAPTGRANRRLVQQKANLETTFNDLKNIYSKVSKI